MPIILIPIVFAFLGAGVSYGVGRAQHLGRRALWASVIAGAVGGAVGGALTVPALGLGAAITGATALPTAVGATAELGALAGAQAAGNGVGQVIQNRMTGRPARENVGTSMLIGGGSQAVLGPAGARIARAVEPALPAAGRGLSTVLTRTHLLPGETRTATATAISAAASRWASETTSEGLTDLTTSLAPIGSSAPAAKPEPVIRAPRGSEVRGFSDALGRLR